MNGMQKLFSKIMTAALYPQALLIIYLKAGYNWLRSLGGKPMVHFERPHEGEPIMLLALYQKGNLRPDVLRLIKQARKRGFYVLAVNTLRLDQPESLSGLIDCYIERYNHGRDFGSYKTGFLHLFSRNWENACPRLLLVNDSVYFSRKRLAKFLDDMLETQYEVLGSTENYEIEHHLGSFCISISGKILQRPAFCRYWQAYRPSDVRPRVIRSGEMKLSRTLRRSVGVPDSIQTLYGTQEFMTRLERDRDFTDFAFRNTRDSNLAGWKRITVQGLVKAFEEKYMVDIFENREETLNIDVDYRILSQKAYLASLDDLEKFLNRNIDSDRVIERKLLLRLVISEMTSAFMAGSQIHQNAAVLLRMGLPLIKLDGLYRGMFNIHDIQNICSYLDDDEVRELKKLLLARPYGGDVLLGWKRAAFMRGLI